MNAQDSRPTPSPDPDPGTPETTPSSSPPPPPDAKPPDAKPPTVFDSPRETPPDARPTTPTQSDGSDKSDKSDGSDRSDGSDGSDKSDRSDRSDGSDGSDGSDKSDRSDKGESPPAAPSPSPKAPDDLPALPSFLSESPDLEIPDFVLDSIRIDADGEGMTAGVDPLGFEKVLDQRPRSTPPPPAFPTPETDEDSDSSEAETASDRSVSPTEPKGADASASGASPAAAAQGGPTPASGTSAPGPPANASPGDADSETKAAPEPQAAPSFVPEEGESVFQFAREVADLCFSRLGDWALARDAAAETLGHALRSDRWGKMERAAQRKQILGIAKGVCFDLLRRTLLMHGGPSAPSSSPPTSPPTSPPSSPPTSPAAPPTPPKMTPLPIVLTAHDPYSVDARERSRALIGELPEPQRSVARMRLWNGATFLRIAQAIDKTEQSVVSIYRAALKNLGKRLSETPEGNPSEAAEGEGDPVALPDNPHDRALLGPEGVHQETELIAHLPRPEGATDQHILVGIARRVLIGTSVIEGTLRYLHGPLDILPAYERHQNLAKLKGEGSGDHVVGDRLFGGETLATGGDATALLALRTGHEILLAPETLVVLGVPEPKADQPPVLVLLQGRVIFLPGTQVTAALTVNFPGGAIHSMHDAFQVVVLSLASSRIETIDGTPTVSNNSGKQSPGRGKSVMCRGGAKPAIAPARRETTWLDWTEAIVNSSSFPPDTRTRFDALATPQKPKAKIEALQPKTPAQAAALAKLREEKMVKIAVGVLVALVVLVGGFFFVKARFGEPKYVDWYQKAQQERRRALQLPAIPVTGPMAGVTLISPRGGPLMIATGQIPVVDLTNPMAMMMGGGSMESFRLSHLNSEKQMAHFTIQSEPAWPEEAESLALEFCRHFSERNPERLALITPGFPFYVWGFLLRQSGTVESYSVHPGAVPSPQPGVSVFNADLMYAQGTVRFELVIVSGPESGERPYVDVLATRWGTPPGGP